MDVMLAEKTISNETEKPPLSHRKKEGFGVAFEAENKKAEEAKHGQKSERRETEEEEGTNSGKKAEKGGEILVSQIAEKAPKQSENNERDSLEEKQPAADIEKSQLKGEASVKKQSHPEKAVDQNTVDTSNKKTTPAKHNELKAKADSDAHTQERCGQLRAFEKATEEAMESEQIKKPPVDEKPGRVEKKAYSEHSFAPKERSEKPTRQTKENEFLPEESAFRKEEDRESKIQERLFSLEGFEQTSDTGQSKYALKEKMESLQEGTSPLCKEPAQKDSLPPPASYDETDMLSKEEMQEAGRRLRETVLKELKIRSFQERPHEEVTIRLEPKSLGEMSIRVIKENGRMTAHITVESPLAKEILFEQLMWMRQRLPQMEVALQQDSLLKDGRHEEAFRQPNPRKDRGKINRLVQKADSLTGLPSGINSTALLDARV